jgi:hypothetical protein
VANSTIDHRLHRFSGLPCRAGWILLVLSPLFGGCLDSSGGGEPDPVVVEEPVAFVVRPLMLDEMTGERLADNRAEPGSFRPGARLLIKDRAAASAEARDVISRLFPDEDGSSRYDLKDLSVSHDGTRLLFAMRAPEIEDADDDEQPTWNIWEYEIPSDSLRRIVESDVIAETGQDIAPAYLPDGRIVFSSTRQRRSRAILLDEGKPQYPALDEDRQGPAFVLHVMEADGSGIEQITFNQSHDLDPAVARDGYILFSRWDNAGQTRNNGANLYRVNPDGTELTYLFGRNSHRGLIGEGGVQFLEPVPADNGSVRVSVRPWEATDARTVVADIDVARFVEADRTIEGNTGNGVQPAVLPDLELPADISLTGEFGPVSELNDGTGRYLVSWSPCRLRPIEEDGPLTNCTTERIESGDYRAANPAFGLWLFEPDRGTRRPLVRPEEGVVISDAVLVRSRTLEDYRAPAQYTGEAATLAETEMARVDIRSVYDLDGEDVSPLGIAATANPGQMPPDQLPARFLRIVKPVSIPDDDVFDFDNAAFGRSRGQSMREILGYVPVEPDGSARFAVPANVAFGISVVDQYGRRISDRHQNWLHLRPGETLGCQGCHDAASDIPHGRPDASPPAVWQGAPTTGLPFPNTRPELFADMGETMAQVWSRINQTRRPGPDAVREDVWTDPLEATPGATVALRYTDLRTPAPVPDACLDNWTARCRIVINYEQHIHPLWNLERTEEVEENGETVTLDYTCTGCHTAADADGAVRIPDGQLDLTDGASDQNADHFRAYRELLFTDNEQELVDGMLSDIMVDTGEFERDEEGELILDGAGNPIPILVPIPVPASMSVNGALASEAFMSLFLSGGAHEGFLEPAELRLIAEWLDIGAQYYNNPFDAPED